ncbi:hypothetical protein U1Q18_024851 [Sarracenia purpurea var. burkii]
MKNPCLDWSTASSLITSMPFMFGSLVLPISLSLSLTLVLPFETIEEAVSSMGRNLTFAGIQWLHYSTKNRTILMYCHNPIFLFFFYTSLPLPYMIAELTRSNGIDKFKVQPKIKNYSSDMFNGGALVGCSWGYHNSILNPCPLKRGEEKLSDQDITSYIMKL